jgi:phosphatidylinositol alpha-mannosyltransferase
VASDLDAFRRVLRDGECGELAAVGDGASLAAALTRTLTDHDHRAGLRARGGDAVREYDWPVVADRVVRVYETIRGPGETLRVR